MNDGFGTFGVRWRRSALAAAALSACAALPAAACGKGGSAAASDTALSAAAAAQQLEVLCPGVYVDRDIDVARRALLVRALDQARQRNLDFFGALKSAEPSWVVCSSEACKRTFAGPLGRSITLARGHAAPGADFRASDYTIVLVPTRREADADALIGLVTHERLHVELDRRKGPAGFVPAWFNEGLATWVSGSPACTPPALGAEPGERLAGLLTQTQWDERSAAAARAARSGRSVYCLARDEVEAWISRHGAQRVVELLDAIGSGRQSFFQGYGPMLTQP
jgi:hypothetical protein